MADYRILKVVDENEDPLPGAWGWGGPGVLEDQTSGHISICPLCYIEPNSGDGQLMVDLGYERLYITEATFAELVGAFGTINAPE